MMLLIFKSITEHKEAMVGPHQITLLWFVLYIVPHENICILIV